MVIACCHEVQGQGKEALDLAERAVERHVDTLGEKHPYTLQAPALMYQTQGQPERAIALEEDVLSQWRSEFGDDDVITAQLTRNLAWIYGENGRASDARDLASKDPRITQWSNNQ